RAPQLSKLPHPRVEHRAAIVVGAMAVAAGGAALCVPVLLDDAVDERIDVGERAAVPRIEFGPGDGDVAPSLDVAIDLDRRPLATILDRIFVVCRRLAASADDAEPGA